MRLSSQKALQEALQEALPTLHWACYLPGRLQLGTLSLSSLSSL